MVLTWRLALCGSRMENPMTTVRTPYFPRSFAILYILPSPILIFPKSYMGKTNMSNITNSERSEIRSSFSRKLQRRVLRQIASPIQHSITQHNVTPQQDTPQQDPPQHHTPQQDIHRSKTPHLQTGLYSILIIFLIIS